MSLNYETLAGTLPGASGKLIFMPSAWVEDATGHATYPPAQVEVNLAHDGSFTVSLLATDNDVTPSDWTWTVEFLLAGVEVYSFKFALPHTEGGTTHLDELTAL